MNKKSKDLQRIRQIASRVRKQCEKFADSPDNHFLDNLEGLCAIASYILQKELHKKGIDTKLIQGNFLEEWDEPCPDPYNHCWIEWKDYIIDVTATQFGFKRKVYIHKNSRKQQIRLTF